MHDLTGLRTSSLGVILAISLRLLLLEFLLSLKLFLSFHLFFETLFLSHVLFLPFPLLFLFFCFFCFHLLSQNFLVLKLPSLPQIPLIVSLKAGNLLGHILWALSDTSRVFRLITFRVGNPSELLQLLLPKLLLLLW